jgi:phosphoribosyl-ATP pyrophosphohydrolase/phosphoribosyl-AMP cyclohydrolase/histidinol dehydrogenase
MGVKIVEASSVNAGDSETLDTKVMAFAEACLAKVKAEGAPAVYAYAGQFGELKEGQSAVVDKAAMKAAYDGLDADDRACLEACGARIKSFALAQKASFVDMETPIPGGVAGHTVSPVEVAGCYAPGGRYPLPSSVLMTAVTARAAGVKTVVVATPKPLPVTLAAAHVAGADVLVAVGGAHAIAAMATGALAKEGVPRADVLCGPGNAWVTAAKACAATSARVGIDMIAGPSEVLVICDETADAATVAADMLAQAEHDVVARPIVVAFSSDGSGKAGALKMIAKVNAALDAQLENLPTKAVAAPACARGFAVACESVDEALRVSDAVAPEHLEVICENERAVADRCNHYGGLFVGSRSAEVMGDYGIGPNHTLPTSGTARYTGGLCVMDFLRIRTWMRIDDGPASQGAVRDAVRLARIEGLEGHARAAEARLLPPPAKKQKV